MLSYTSFKNDNTTDWVTFIHGAGGSSSIWYKQIRDFNKEYNVLLIDLRGHGKSKKHLFEKLKRYTFDVIGDDVIEVLDHLKIKATHFVGISLGTIIIREITERYPERTKSMILGGAVMRINIRGQMLMRMSTLFKSIIPYIVLYKILSLVIMPRKKHRESRHLFINEAKKIYHKEFKRWFKLTSQVNGLLSFFRLKDCGIPTLYIMGSEDHMFLPSISKLVKNHLSSRLIVVQNCGHVVNIDQSEEFNSKVLGYLSTL